MIGIDYNNTITKDEKLFKRLAGALLAAGYPVYIITAMKRPASQERLKQLRKTKVPHTAIEIVYFKDFTEIPRLKLQACQRLGVKLLFDDMPEVTELVSQHKILTCLVK